MNFLRRTFFNPKLLTTTRFDISKLQTFSQVGETRQTEGLEKSFNQVILLGRAGNNPEQRGTVQNPVVTFSLATNINYSKENELIQQTEWHRISVFRPFLRDKVIQYLTKGSRIMVRGRISYFERKDSANENIIYKNAVIIADDVIFFAK